MEVNTFGGGCRVGSGLVGLYLRGTLVGLWLDPLGTG